MTTLPPDTFRYIFSEIFVIVAKREVRRVPPILVRRWESFSLTPLDLKFDLCPEVAGAVTGSASFPPWWAYFVICGGGAD